MQIVNGRIFLLIEVFQLVNEERIIELEFATPNELMDLDIYHRLLIQQREPDIIGFLMRNTQ